MPPTIRARLDASLSARIVRALPLLYAEGTDAALDRPAYVRSASGITRVAGCVAVVQDDANFVAVVDAATGLAGAITLPAGEGGRRQFDDLRGNKRFKLDLESCVTVDDDDEDREMLLAFGSGSLPARERIVLVRRVDAEDADARVIDASALYARFHATPAFSGSELNVEGAAVLGGTLRLFNRGNGAPRGELVPVNASCDVDLAALLAWLRDPSSAPPPLREVVRYDLGAIDGVPLTLTDAATLGASVLFAAAAEASPDATRDGPVAGCAIGIITGDSARYCEVEAMDGGPYRGKIEGILPLSSGRLLAVVDPDDPRVPSTLLEIAMDGGWA